MSRCQQLAFDMHERILKDFHRDNCRNSYLTWVSEPAYLRRVRSSIDVPTRAAATGGTLEPTSLGFPECVRRTITVSESGPWVAFWRRVTTAHCSFSHERQCTAGRTMSASCVFCLLISSTVCALHREAQNGRDRTATGVTHGWWDTSAVETTEHARHTSGTSLILPVNNAYSPAQETENARSRLFSRRRYSRRGDLRKHEVLKCEETQCLRPGLQTTLY